MYSASLVPLETGFWVEAGFCACVGAGFCVCVVVGAALGGACAGLDGAGVVVDVVGVSSGGGGLLTVAWLYEQPNTPTYTNMVLRS